MHLNDSVNSTIAEGEKVGPAFRDRFFVRQDAYALFLPTSVTPFAVKEPVTLDVITAHLTGAQRIGAYSTALGDSCLWGCIDIDHTGHEKTLPFEEAQRLYDLGVAIIAKARELGASAYLERSKRGAWHVWLFAQSPISAALMRRVLRALLAACGFPMPANASKSGAIEIFPAQDGIGTGYGNPVFLPYFGGDPLGMTVFVQPDHPELKAVPVDDFLSQVVPIPVALLAEVGSKAQAPQSNGNSHASAHNPSSTDEDASLLLARFSSKCERFKTALGIQEQDGLEEPDWFAWIHSLTTAGYAEAAQTFSALSNKHDRRSESRLSTCERDVAAGKAKPPVRCTTFGCSEEQIHACFGGVVYRKEDGISNNPMGHLQSETHGSAHAGMNGHTPPPETEWSDEVTFDVPPPDHFPCTDLGNGERFHARYGADLRYCNAWKKFLTWDGKRWELDNRQTVKQWARLTVRAVYDEARRLTTQAKDADAGEPKEKIVKRATALLKHAVRSEAEPRLNAAISLAQMDVPVLPDELDVDHWLLNVSNGTLDLRTGELQSHQREDLITKMISIAYDPEARCPQWKQFLYDIMAGNQTLVNFLWKAIGYSLTGDCREDCLFILHGGGANGKSTLLETLRAVLGDYGCQAETSTFLHKDRDGVRNDIADLRGARFVSAVEVDEGRRLSEAVVKSLTGRDTMKARFLFQEHFEFKPQLKLWLGTNNKPVIRGTDDGIWRRIRLVPFAVMFEEGKNRDKELPDKLLSELSGILAWAVQGCLAWQEEGLPMPEAVKAATAGYRAEMDIMGAFIEECCEVGTDYQALTGALFSAYIEWAKANNEETLSKKMFGMRLESRGLKNGRNRFAARCWFGLRLQGTQEQ